MVKESLAVRVNSFSFRAECRHDVLQFLALPEASSLRKIIITPDPRFPDVEVIIETELTLEDIVRALELIEDGHVMVESIEAHAHRLYSLHS